MTNDEKDKQGHSVLDDGLAFFGAITASVSHELNNVMSIIDQTAGLLQDMIAAEREGIPINIDRVAGVVGTVQTQAERGLGVIRRLNRFSHSADEARVEFDVAEVLGNLVELCQRLAELKYVQLRLRSSPERLKLVGSPFFVQAAVFRSLRLALDAAERNDTVDVSAEANGNGVLVRLNCPRRIDTSHGDVAALRLVAGYVNARMKIKNEGHGTVVEVAFSGERGKESMG
jgi:signal transduction histidine kinase